MRPRILCTPLRLLVWTVCTSACHLDAAAQPTPGESPRHAVLSSGGNAASRPGVSNSSLRPTSSADAWTSNNNPVAGATGPAGPNGLPDYGSVVMASGSAPARETLTPQHRSTASPSSADPPSASPQATRTPLKPPSQSTAGEQGQGSGGGTLRMFFSVGSSLLVVIGLFLGVAWCYRRTLSKSLGGLPKQVVSVLGRTPLAARQQLVLVRFGPKLVLVSMVQGEARTISEITDPVEVDQLAGFCESGQPGSVTSSFRSILQHGGNDA